MGNNKSAQAELALAVWADLDELIVAKIDEQGRVITSLIESNKHLFPREDMRIDDAGSDSVVTMLRMLHLYAYYYYNGHFYFWDGMVNTGTGVPRGQAPKIVHLQEGKKLHDLLRNKDFISMIAHEIEMDQQPDEEEGGTPHTYGSLHGGREHPDPDNAP